jgi:hypothetical protein
VSTVRIFKKIPLPGAEKKGHKITSAFMKSALNYFKIVMQGQRYGTTHNKGNMERRQHCEKYER